METKNSNLTEDILIKIIKKNTNRDVYNKLEIEVLVNTNYTINDIIRFFIRHYAHPKKLASDIKEYQKLLDQQKNSSKMKIIKIWIYTVYK